MTDGYIGNDGEIISEIQKHPNARVFGFGIGGSVNRHLLDKMAEEGRGEVEYVTLQDDGSAAAKRFHERVRNPLLTDISLDFGGLDVADVYPQKINDLFSAKPVIIHGRFKKAGSGTVKLKGKSFGRETVREIAVNFPENEAAHDVLATLWARTRIDDLTRADYAGVQNGTAKPEIKDTITNLGIEFRLLTQFTSFVAVEERVVTDGGVPRKIEVPVEMPEGVSREGVFGENDGSPGYGSMSKRKDEKKFLMRKPAPKNYPVTTEKSGKRTLGDAIIGRTIADEDGGIMLVSGEEQSRIYQQIEASNLVKPDYPMGKSFGPVEVEVTLDAGGKVIAAKARKGPKVFYQATETAALNSAFTLPKFTLEITKVTGLIVYDFKPDNKTVAVSENLQNARIELKPNKYHTSIRGLVERLKNNQAAGADEAKFVQNGKASVIVRVNELKPEVVAQLKSLGFEVLTEMASARAVVGQIPVEKLSALAELEAVTFISPQNR